MRSPQLTFRELENKPHVAACGNDKPPDSDPAVLTPSLGLAAGRRSNTWTKHIHACVSQTALTIGQKERFFSEESSRQAH